MSRIRSILKLSQTASNLQNVAQNIPVKTASVVAIAKPTDKKPNPLMAFFDDEKNWSANEVKVGRSWRTDELRLKSNIDLHKLWYVLLKERNMLLTMEHESKEQMKLFPNPERIDKVKESMDNLEVVVRERNKAYHLLETGETGEREGKLARNIFGLNYFYKYTEHIIPKFMNTTWRNKMYFYKPSSAVSKFLKLYREKLWNEKRKKMNRDFSHVTHLMKRFPNMDLEAVKRDYPTVDLKKAKNHANARGHFEPK